VEEKVKKSRLHQLLDPVFVAALLVLLLNDHVWKAMYHNFWTGKLSDFAGLYAFAWVGMSLLPGKRTAVAWLTGLAFLFWKSPLSEPLLAGWNAADLLPLQRVVDYGDWVAIAVLPFARRRSVRVGLRLAASLAAAEAPFLGSLGTVMRPLSQVAVLALSLFAFCATSYKNDFVFEAKYDLALSPSEVAQRLNALTIKAEIDNPHISLHHENANQFIDQGERRLYLRHSSETEMYHDTAWVQSGDSQVVGDVTSYPILAIDSMYVNPAGYFKYNFRLQRKGGDHHDQGACMQAPAILQLVAHGQGSRLFLHQIELHNCDAVPKDQPSEKPERYLEKRFEDEVVAFLKKP
jgi:hypothetical protein